MSLFPVRGLPRGNTLEVLDEEEIQREMEVKLRDNVLLEKNC